MQKKRTGHHGTLSEYIAGCRCEPCKTNQRKMSNAARERARARVKNGAKPKKHGITGYNYYGCRCEICREADSKRYKRHRDGDREARRKRQAEQKFEAWSQNLTFPEV